MPSMRHKTKGSRETATFTLLATATVMMRVKLRVPGATPSRCGMRVTAIAQTLASLLTVRVRAFASRLAMRVRHRHRYRLTYIRRIQYTLTNSKGARL